MKKFSKKQWIKFSIAAVLYLLFTLWMQNAWLLLGLIVLVDIFLTGYILGSLETYQESAGTQCVGMGG